MELWQGPQLSHNHVLPTETVKMLSEFIIWTLRYFTSYQSLCSEKLPFIRGARSMSMKFTINFGAHSIDGKTILIAIEPRTSWNYPNISKISIKLSFCHILMKSLCWFFERIKLNPYKTIVTFTAWIDERWIKIVIQNWLYVPITKLLNSIVQDLQ
jgi:hypothetical protein